MSKVTLGLILSGDPACRQEKGSIMRVCEFVFKYGWIVAGGLAAINFIGFCVNYSEKRVFLFLGGFVLAAMLLALDQLLWNNDKERCPDCHHFFAMEKISEDRVVGSSTRGITRTVEEYHSGMAFDLSGNSAYMVGKTSYKENGTEKTTTYVHSRRCKICGCVCKVEHKKTTESF